METTMSGASVVRCAGGSGRGHQPRQPDDAVPDTAARQDRRPETTDLQHRRGLIARQEGCGPIQEPRSAGSV